MRTGQRGIDLIKEFEGFSATMYLDPVGLPTIGYGTLIDTDAEQYLMTATITQTEAEALLRTELIHIEYQITKMVQRPINQNQFDALASFCYNLGTGNLRISTLLKKINANPIDPTIRAEFLKWHHAGGRDLTGLKRRRQAEAILYYTTV
jgi:lysozyme